MEAVEYKDTNYRVARGGRYGIMGSNYPVSLRSIDNPTSTYGNFGFRITLIV